MEKLPLFFDRKIRYTQAVEHDGRLNERERIPCVNLTKLKKI